MEIVSGVSRRTVMRLGFMFLLLAIFSGWFVYDGWITYPRKNLEAARQAFPQTPKALPQANPAVTAETVKSLRPDGEGRVRLEDLQQKWGQPAYLSPSGGESGGTDRVAYFVGPYGWARVNLDASSAGKIEWREGPKVSSDISVQKMLGVLLGAGAALPLALLLVQLPNRYVLDDQGLTLPKIGRITYDQMTGVDIADFGKKGIVRLKYRGAQGEEQVAVLDEEKIAKFDEIVAACCEKKGWPIEIDEEPEQVDPGKPQP
jgi:hypothetical protein